MSIRVTLKKFCETLKIFCLSYYPVLVTILTALSAITTYLTDNKPIQPYLFGLTLLLCILLAYFDVKKGKALFQTNILEGLYRKFMKRTLYPYLENFYSQTFKSNEDFGNARVSVYLFDQETENFLLLSRKANPERNEQGGELKFSFDHEKSYLTKVFDDKNCRDRVLDITSDMKTYKKTRLTVNHCMGLVSRQSSSSREGAVVLFEWEKPTLSNADLEKRLASIKGQTASNRYSFKNLETYLNTICRS